MKIDLVVQRDAMDCGPSCLLMISRYYGRNLPLENLREMCYITKTGVSLLGISDAAEKIGFRTTGAKVRILDLLDVQLPCIAHWKGNHFIVVYDVKKSKDGVCVCGRPCGGEANVHRRRVWSSLAQHCRGWRASWVVSSFQIK